MIYRFGDCTLDTQRHRLQRAGQPVRLRAKAFQVLLYLVEHRDRTVLKPELYAQVWPQQFISEATLESTVRAVRQAIGDSGRAQQLIQTVYGYGYRFVATVEELADLPAEIEDKAPGMLPDAVAAHPQDPSDVVPLPPAQGPAVEPGGREGGGDRDQEGAPPPGDLLQPGEWKLVTVLCAAPVTRSAGGAQQDADTWYRQLSRLYTLAQPVVQRYEGTLQPVLGDHVLGDHVLAVFGAPVAQEDHAQRAVLAALELQRRVREAGIDGRAQQRDALGLRVGLHTGPVAVGGIGDVPAGLAAVVGETVMRALALQAQAAPGTILCSDATAHLVQGMVGVASVATVPMAGESTPVAAYTVLGPYRRRPFRALAHRVWAPFVGRRRELATLRALLAQVEEGRGQVVGMIGEPGVGKSRLCYEFLCGSLAHPWVILETQGTAYGQATPYLPVIDLLKGYFRIDDRDDLPTICDKVTAKLRRLDKSLTPTTPAFLTLLDVPVEDPPWQALEAPQRRQRTLDALKRILIRESQVQPLLLVVENLHWIDAETQAVLDTLVDSLPAARLFLLTTYRPEYHHGWGNKTSYTQLRLDPLSRESARELVNSLLGDDAALAPLKQRLTERTRGNPFFLEESIRTLVEMKSLVGGPGAYCLTQALPTIQVPATVQAVLAARIDRLAAEEKHLLQTAAVIGTEVPFSLLQAVAELPEEGLRTGLAHLQGAEFLYETRLFPELAYTFKHALTQEVADGSLLPDRRRTLHARIVRAIETLNPDRLAEQVERLAHHALWGEVWDKALSYSRQAGARAGTRSAYQEAVTSFEQALKALTHLPESRDTLEQAIDLRFDLRASLLPLGEFGRMLDYLREAETLAEALDDRGRQGWIAAYLMNYFVVMGDHGRAIASAQHALALATALGDVALQVHAHQRLGRVYLNLGDYCQATDVLKRNVASLEGKLLWEHFGEVTPPSVQSRGWLVRCLAELGEFAEGSAYAEEAVRLAEAVDRPFGLIQICEGVGSLYLRKGDLHEAIPLLERGLALCKAADVRILLPTSASTLGYAYALAGRIAEAVALLEQAVELATSMRQAPQPALTRARLSEGYLLAGGNEKAYDLAWQALTLSRDRRERGNEAWALRILGEIASSRDPPKVDQAENYYQQALALAKELSMRPLVAHCHCGLGTLYATIGRPEQARAELTAAIELYRAMDMTFWLLQAEAALARMA